MAFNILNGRTCDAGNLQQFVTVSWLLVSNMKGCKPVESDNFLLGFEPLMSANHC